MARGPHVKGPLLVERLEGSDPAKRKLQIVLETIAGRRSIESACQELGIGPAAFHEIRAKLLKGALELLEPRPPGRPPRPVSESESRISELELEVRRLRMELDIAHVREEVLLAMPGVFQPAKAARKKKRDRAGRAQRGARPGGTGSPAPGGPAPPASSGDRAGEEPGPAERETTRR